MRGFRLPVSHQTDNLLFLQTKYKNKRRNKKDRKKKEREERSRVYKPKEARKGVYVSVRFTLFCIAKDKPFRT